MIKQIFLVFIIHVFLLAGCKYAGEKQDSLRFSLDSISKQYTFVSKGDSGIIFHPDTEMDALKIDREMKYTNWADFNYLILDVYHNNDYSAILYVDFFPKTHFYEDDDRQIVEQGGASGQRADQEPAISFKIGVLPNLTTSVIVPLNYLDGQKVFLPRYYRQLKGTVLGKRLDPDDIGSVRLRLAPVEEHFKTRLSINAISLTRDLPDRRSKIKAPYVDQFGQWTSRNWKGKIRSESHLKRKLTRFSEKSSQSDWPEGWSNYGGWKELKFKGTGFFRTHFDGRRWWFVDPEGYAFLSTGIDCVRPSVSATITGREELFEWLPEKNDAVLGQAYQRHSKIKAISLDFAKANLLRVFEDDWLLNWNKMIEGFLKNHRFNTIGNWSDEGFINHSDIPFVFQMKDFPRTNILVFRDFPDVFSSEYLEAAKKYAQQLKPYKDNRYMIGYFLRNEPHWAFGDHNLAYEMLKTKQKSATKKEFVAWLKSKYKNRIDLFNKSWRLKLASFAELQDVSFKRLPSQMAGADMKEFSGLMVDQYLSVVVREVKRVDPNHLNLGMRYAWISSDLCYRAGNHFDVFSINGYHKPGPPPTDLIMQKTGKPVLIGEFHFGAIDRGLPATGIQGVEDQRARGDAYQYYVEQGFTRPELIGIHYFQLYDQPISGRFDGENYQIGFLDICHSPYKQFTRDARMANEKVYKVALGEKKPFAKTVKPFPQIYY